MNKFIGYKKLTLLLAVILLALLGDRFIFMSSGIKIDMNPEVLRASVGSSVTIRVIPVNMLGFKTPFGETNARFEIEDGKNLVEMDEVSAGIVNVRSKGIEGEATIAIYSVKSGVLLQKLLLKILPKSLALN